MCEPKVSHEELDRVLLAFEKWRQALEEKEKAQALEEKKQALRKKEKKQALEEKEKAQALREDVRVERFLYTASVVYCCLFVKELAMLAWSKRTSK